MPHRLLFFDVILAFSVVLAVPAHANAGGPDFFKVSNLPRNDVLHMRTKPSARANIVKKLLPSTTHLRNLGCVDVVRGEARPMSEQIKGSLWCKVEVDGSQGWVSGRFLTEE